jgi:hypothetical protein
MYLAVAALVLIFASPVMAQPVAAKTISWTLSGGQVKDLGDGAFELTATAQADFNANVKAGTFYAKCSVVDGKLTGVWDITRAGAQKTVRSNPNSIRGTISGDAPASFDAFTATVSVSPNRRHPKKEAKATGELQWPTAINLKRNK